MQLVKDWCDYNSLTINVSKTKMMYFSTRDDVQHRSVTLDDVDLEIVHSYKYLGITLDDELSFQEQQMSTVKSLNSKIWLLRRLRPLLTQRASITVLKAMILPQIDSSLVFLAGRKQTDLYALQVLQNMAIRICLKIDVPREVHTDVIHSRTSVVKVESRLFYLQSIMCHRLVKRDGLALIENRFTRAADGPLVKQINPHQTRYSKNPMYKAIETWNSLPPATRNVIEKNEFRTKIKNYIKGKFPLILPNPDHAP